MNLRNSFYNHTAKNKSCAEVQMSFQVSSKSEGPFIIKVKQSHYRPRVAQRVPGS
jgi:hypothetical protein